MDKKKLSNYKLTGSIHTLNIQVPGRVTVPEEMRQDGTAKVVYTPPKDRAKDLNTHIKINPNAMNGDLFSFGEYERSMQEIINRLEITEYRLSRADLRLDSLQEGFFQDYWKLHRYLISALALEYGVRNRYKTEDLISDDKLSLSVKGRGFEIEFYDKRAEMHGKGIVMARLEERSLARGEASLSDLAFEFGEAWKERWNAALQKLDYVQKVYNTYMHRHYREKVLAHGLKVNEFLLINAENFFTRDQMIQFLTEVGNIDNPQKVAGNFKDRYSKKCNLEFFSKADCKHAIDEINRATDAFLNGENASIMRYSEAV